MSSSHSSFVNYNTCSVFCASTFIHSMELSWETFHRQSISNILNHHCNLEFTCTAPWSGLFGHVSLPHIDLLYIAWPQQLSVNVTEYSVTLNHLHFACMQSQQHMEKHCQVLLPALKIPDSTWKTEARGLKPSLGYIVS